MEKPGFEIDKAGLEKLLARRGREFAVLELIQNALDEDGVTRVDVTLDRLEGGYHRLTVTDDAPAGFADLAHAWTLFAESRKKGAAEKRGRFNLGEKLVLACCRKARIVTTSGGVEWFSVGQRWLRRSLRERRAAGSAFVGEMRMTIAEADVARAEVRSVIVPEGVQVTMDGEVVASRGRDARRAIWTMTLPTETADADGYLRRAERQTTVVAYDPPEGRTARIYELGIPVVEIDGAFDVDVRQKIPLNTDRDNVTPGYLRAIRAATLEHTYDLIDKEQARAAWVDDALESGSLGAEAVASVMTARYGEKRVVRDPSDPESTKLAVSQGYAVVEPGAFSRAAWETLRRTSAVLPSGRVTPSNASVAFSADGDDVCYPRTKWSPGMRVVVAFARELSRRVTGARVIVDVVCDPRGYAACYHYRASFEMIGFYEKGKRRLNDLGVCDVLRAPRVTGYPTEKPTSVSRTLIEQSTLPGELVLDCFMGSGSVGEAALSCGRRFVGCDLAARSVDMTRPRLVAAGGVEVGPPPGPQQARLFG